MLKKIIICFLFLCPLLASADIVFPTQTNFYFTQNHQPINEPLSVEISCYGYSYAPGPSPDREIGSYSEEKVFGFKADCPYYGCASGESYYLNYRQIDFCYLEARTRNNQIYKKNIGNLPYSQCESIGMQMKCTTTVDFQAAGNTTSGSSFISLFQNNFYLAMIITLASELLILLLLIKFAFKSISISCRKAALSGFLASLATLPAVWFVVPDVLNRLLFFLWPRAESFYLYLAISELIAVLLEAVIYQQIIKIKFSRALYISLACNAVSLAIGLILYFVL